LIFVVLTFGLTVGLASAVFCVAEAVLFRPLPFRDPEQLCAIWKASSTRPGERYLVSRPEFSDWQELNEVFEKLAAYDLSRMDLSVAGSRVRVQGARTSASLFSLLDVRPIVGRTFRENEDRAEAGHIALLSEGFWKEAFAADPKVIGTGIHLDSVGPMRESGVYTVVGVIPDNVALLFSTRTSWSTFRPALFVPLIEPVFGRDGPARRGFNYRVCGRLRRGLTREQAQVAMRHLCERLNLQFPSSIPGGTAIVVSLREDLLGVAEDPLLLLGFVTLLVLAVGCINVGGVVATRVEGRQREYAIRAALGASRGQVARQCLADIVYLGVMGGGVGLLLAHWGTSLLRASSWVPLPRADEIRVDPMAIGFALVVSVLCAVTSGLVPAVHASRSPISSVLNQQNAATGGGNWRSRYVIPLEIALALAVAVDAGLVTRSLLRLVSLDVGFDRRNVLAVDVWSPKPPQSGPTLELGSIDALATRRRHFERDLLSNLAGFPRVARAAVSSDLPVGDGALWRFSVVGSQARHFCEIYAIGGEFFDVLRVPMLHGRTLNQADDAGVPVAVVSESLARNHLTEDGLGQQIRIGDTSYKVVGVAQDMQEITAVREGVRRKGLAQTSVPAVYVSTAHAPFDVEHLVVLVRTVGDPMVVSSVVRTQISKNDSTMSIGEVSTLEERATRSWFGTRFLALAIDLFAGVALVLACVGTYGSVSLQVNRRRAEIGIRMAIGALPAEVRVLVLGSLAKSLLVGVAIGLGLSALGSTYADQYLFDVNWADPLTLFVAVSVLVLTSLASAWRPMRVSLLRDPAVWLRRGE